MSDYYYRASICTALAHDSLHVYSEVLLQEILTSNMLQICVDMLRKVVVKCFLNILD